MSAPGPAMSVTGLDHLVLTVDDVDATVAFYCTALGMREVVFGDGRRALAFGDQKINLHPRPAPIAPHARRPTTGSADLCFRTDVPIAQVIGHLQAHGVAVEEGPVARTGAISPLLSVYVRDPDGNLVEISNAVLTQPSQVELRQTPSTVSTGACEASRSGAGCRAPVEATTPDLITEPRGI